MFTSAAASPVINSSLTRCVTLDWQRHWQIHFCHGQKFGIWAIQGALFLKKFSLCSECDVRSRACNEMRHEGMIFFRRYSVWHEFRWSPWPVGRFMCDMNHRKEPKTQGAECQGPGSILRGAWDDRFFYQACWQVIFIFINFKAYRILLPLQS